MVDRIACTGRGICANVQQEAITLDEWGYPIIDDARVDADLIQKTIQLCPARAIYVAMQGPRPSPARRQSTPAGSPTPVARPR